MTGSRAIKLLVSARDPGSTGHIKAIIEDAEKLPHIEVFAYAEGPAFGYLKSAGIEVSLFPLPAMRCVTEEYSTRLKSAARRIIETLSPDAVLTGVSHCHEAGVDEAFLCAAYDRPRFAIQDYWGDVNLSLGEGADLYFTNDQFGVDLTLKRHGKTALAVGSPKHSRYARLDIAAIRRTTRSEIGIALDQKLIGYFGQSLSHVGGYFKQAEWLANAIRSIGMNAVLYRPHPREGQNEIRQTIKIMETAGLAVVLAEDGGIEGWLAAVDVVTSCFSSCAYDALYLNRYSVGPLCTALYIMVDRSVSDYFRTVTSLDQPPPASLGFVRVTNSLDQISDDLLQALDSRYAHKIWSLTQTHLLNPVDSVRDILARIALVAERSWLRQGAMDDR